MKLSPTTRKMSIMVCFCALALFVIGAVIYRSIEALYFAFGVILTSSLNLGKIYLLDRTVKKTLEMDDPNFGKNYVRLQYLLRYFLTAAVLLGAGLVTMYVEPPFINIWGAVAGLFTFQAAVIIVRHSKPEDE